MARALKEAKLRMSNACIEDVDYSCKREFDKAALVRQLGSCRWVAEHQNIVITGKTGTGIIRHGLQGTSAPGSPGHGPLSSAGLGGRLHCAEGCNEACRAPSAPTTVRESGYST